MDAYSDRNHDPLLFLSNDKSDLENFLLTGGDMDHIGDDLHAHITENSLDFDTLEGNGQLGDMNWLHNSSLSTLAHLDGDDTSDGSTMISVNPQAVIPMQVIEPSKPDNLLSSENANSAAMRLHANCSNLIGADSPEEKTSISQANLNQDHPAIRILSVAGSVNSPSKANFIIASPRESPLKSQTFVLNTVNGVITPSHCITTCSQTQVSNSANIVLASPQKLHTISSDKSGRVLLKAGNHLLSPSQASPVLLGRLQTGVQPQIYQASQVVPSSVASTCQPSDAATVSSTTNYGEEKAYPKPVFSYSCLIALALKNSKNGSLPVSEIYNFMCENFPYFKTAPDGWKNSVRHNLSLNKCFAKVDNPKLNQGAKKGCLWALNPAKISKMDEEICKWGKKDPAGLLNSMAYPENLEAIEKGQAGLNYAKRISEESTKCTPLKAEATPTKAEFSPVIKKEFRPICIEKSHSISVDNVVHHMTPVKVKREVPSPHARQTYSPVYQRSYTSSPMSNSDVYNHTSIKPSSTGDQGQRSYSINDIHSTINADALTDIVLQNGMWETEDLENEIDIDLICDSPSSQMLLSGESPLPHGMSPNTVHSTALNSGYCSPSIQSPFSTVVQSPLPQSSPTPNSVRNNLFGVSTPTRRTLYT